MHCFLVLYIQICNVTYILLTNSLQRWSSQSWYNREFKKRPLERQGQRHKPIIWLISGTRENNRAARAVRLLVQFFDEVCQMTTWNCQIWGSDKNATYIRKDFILCLYVKTVRSMEVKRRFAYLLQSDIHRLFTKNWTYSEVLFESYVFVGAS